MQRVATFMGVLANPLFHAFLAAYWYLVHNLYPEYAVGGAFTVYALYLALRGRLTIPLPEPALLLLAAVFFFLMLSPLPSLIGMAQLLWLAGSALVFRLCFAQLSYLKAEPCRHGSNRATSQQGNPRLQETRSLAVSSIGAPTRCRSSRT